MGLKNSRGAPGLAVDLLPINGMKLIVGARLGQRQRAGCHRYSHIWRGAWHSTDCPWPCERGQFSRMPALRCITAESHPFPLAA
jgi:hypothetical protein